MEKIYERLHLPPEKQRKFLMIMKIKLALLLCVGSLNAAQLHSQETVLDVKWEDQTIVSILDELKSDTGYEFFYRKGLIPESQKASVALNGATIEQILDGVLVRNGYSYDIQDKIVLINRAAQPSAGTLPQVQQPAGIRGVVVDADGEPMPGATISVKGSNRGTTADIMGRFVIEAPADDRALVVLVVSFVGYKTQEVNVGDRQDLRIVLEESSEDIEEVVVTGYNVINKVLYTGSVFQLKPDTTMMKTVTTIEDMLQGMVPGMTVINTSGLVGAAPKVRIRGTSTLYGNQSPLWVVDGVIQRDPLPIPEGTGALGENDLSDLREVASSVISWLNPMDIETITVLKDAASTAIYGSQASNGVIVITTKRARAGGFSVSYSGSLAVGQKPDYSQYDMMNSQELMQFSQEMYIDRNTFSDDLLPIGYADLIIKLQNKEISRADFDREFRKLENMNTDWFDILFRNSVSQIHNVSVSGGGEKITNRTSLGVQRILGEARGNDMNNFMVNSATTIRLAEKLIANVSLSGSQSERSGFAFDVDPFSYAMNTSRTTPVYNEDGSLHYHVKNGMPSTAIPNKKPYYNYNILNELDNTSNTNSTQKLQAAFDISWKFGDGFDLRGTFAYSLANSEVRSYATEYSHYITQVRGYEIGEAVGNPEAMMGTPLPFGGVSINENARNRDWSTGLNLNYSRTFKDLHTVMFQLGGEARSARTYGHKDMAFGYLHYRGEKYANVPLAPQNIPGAAEHPMEGLHSRMRMGTSNNNAINNYLSTYLTAIYSYDRRYTVNFNARLDASNRFGQDKNKRFEPNWSAGFKWRLGEEKFMEMASWMDMIDLSFSYGYTGNAVQSVSPYLIATDDGFNEYYQNYALIIKSLPYPSLGWEKKNDWNTEIEFSFLEGRIGLTANLFASKSDVLNMRDIPLENGMRQGIIMGQKMENRGWDIYVNVTPVKTQDWVWTLTFNTGKSKGKMSKTEQENDRDMYLGGLAVVDGEAYSTFWSYSYKGLDGEHGYPTFNYMDIEGGTDNPLAYLVKSGKFEPDFQGGLSTMVRYKSLSMRALFSMSFGAHNRLPYIYNRYGAPLPYQNVPRLFNNRWRQPGDENKAGVMPALPIGNREAIILSQMLPTPEGSPVQENRFTMWHQSDARVASSDFIRCRSIQMSYNLPAKWAHAISAGSASVSLVMANPFTIVFDDKWDGYDPETGNWPLRKTTTFNLSIAF